MKTNKFCSKANGNNLEKDTTKQHDDNESFLEYKKCANCEVGFWQNKTIHDLTFKDLFHDTCIECLQTCSTCGGEIGYLKEENLLSNKPCAVCNKEPCMTCGVTFYCELCDVCCCEDCIDDNESEMICAKMIEKKQTLKKV